MSVSLIVACTKTGVIGKDGKIPWNLPDEMKHFREYTLGKTIIMGRKTFESIGKPLPKRNNVVISSSTTPVHEGVQQYRSLEQAIIDKVESKEDVVIIGGVKIYEAALPFVNSMYISWINDEYEGDTHWLPPVYLSSDWVLERAEDRGKWTLEQYYRYKPSNHLLGKQ